MNSNKYIINPQKKINPKRNPDFLAWKRKRHCLLCHSLMAIPHHVRRNMNRWGGGTSIKPHDYCTLSLCDVNECHNPAHEKLFECERIIIEDMVEYAIEKYGELDLIDGLIEYLESKRRKK